MVAVAVAVARRTGAQGADAGVPGLVGVGGEQEKDQLGLLGYWC